MYLWQSVSVCQRETNKTMVLVVTRSGAGRSISSGRVGGKQRVECRGIGRNDGMMMTDDRKRGSLKER